MDKGLLNQIDELKNELCAMRPLTPGELRRLRSIFVIENER